MKAMLRHALRLAPTDNCSLNLDSLLPESRSNIRDRRTAGVSLVEMLVVLAVAALLATFAIPSLIGIMRAFRVQSDARLIASQLSLTKMRAANAFTQSRLNCNASTRSCRLETCTSKGTNTCNTFTAEGGPIALSQNVNFGFGSIGTAAGSQTTIGNTLQIVFNSRSVPVDNSGVVTGNYALYLTNGSDATYAVTVYASGRIALWQYLNGAWSVQ